MVEHKRSYYAIIPADVRYDKSLTPNAKLLYGEITALCNEKGYCWASNSYFADLYEVSKTSISKWINQLIEKRYLTSDIEYKEGTKEILYRYLRIVTYPIEEKLNTPIEEKLKDNITSFNNTINNTFNIIPDLIDKVAEEAEKPKKKQSTKHKYGEYQNVLLSDEQLENLKDEFPNDWNDRIERVSEYCASKGKTYKDYLATIRSWARKEKQTVLPNVEEEKINSAPQKSNYEGRGY